MIKFRKTNRGFSLGEFVDHYGDKCSIQDSSLATQAAIWLGIDDAKPRICVAGKGWVDVPIPEGTLISTRMHLTIPLAREIRDALDRFIERQTIAPQNDEEETIHCKTQPCVWCEKEYEFDPNDRDDRYCSEACIDEHEEYDED